MGLEKSGPPTTKKKGGSEAIPEKWSLEISGKKCSNKYAPVKIQDGG